jgi:hypothetical protein
VCLAWAKQELEEAGEAEHLVAQAVTRLRADNYQLALADALRVQGLVAIKQQRWLEAARSLEEGLALAQRVGYPYAEARLLHVDGLLHVQQGESEAARVRLEAALALFRRLGARKDVERTEHLLAALG